MQSDLKENTIIYFFTIQKLVPVFTNYLYICFIESIIPYTHLYENITAYVLAITYFLIYVHVWNVILKR